MTNPKKWWLISNQDVEAIAEALQNPTPEKLRDALHDLDSGCHITDEIPDDWNEKPLLKVELTIDQWVLRYGYAVAKSHRYDSAWMLGSLLGVDIKDAVGEPCNKEVFRNLLIEKYNTLSQTVKTEEQK